MASTNSGTSGGVRPLTICPSMAAALSGMNLPLITFTASSLASHPVSFFHFTRFPTQEVAAVEGDGREVAGPSGRGKESPAPKPRGLSKT